MKIQNRFALGLAAVVTLTQITAAAKPVGKLESELSNRSLVIVVDSDAPAPVKAAAEVILSSVKTQTLLKLMAGDHQARIVDSESFLSGKSAVRTFNHVIVVGMPQSEVVTQVWQHEALVEPGGISVFGFGHFKGDLGYIESQRNPYLHSNEVGTAPFEAEMATISGTTPAGVAMAADAFVHRGVINGVIAKPNGWSRPSTTLLDEPPVTADAQLPEIPAQLGKSPLIGVSQAGGDEYRNVLADAHVEPKTIWRFKYYVKGAWDAPDTTAAIAEYNAGLHRRAFADTLWVGVFATPEDAKSAAGRIAAAAELKEKNGSWIGQGATGTGAPVEIWVNNSTVYMSDLKP